MSHEISLRNAQQKILYEKSMLLARLSTIELQLRKPLQDDWDDALSIASTHIGDASLSLMRAIKALRDE